MTDQFPEDDLTLAIAMAGIQPRDQAASGAGRPYMVLLSGKQTGGRYCMLELVVAPGRGPGMHRHDFEELFILQDGEIKFTVRGEVQAVRAPSCINVPANAPHRFQKTEPKPAHILCICTPAGLEDFFEELNDLMTSREAQSPSSSHLSAERRRALTRELALRYRMEPLDL